MRVRIQKAENKHFKNVTAGIIRCPGNLASDIFSLKSDVLGIYGQNGSGKTTFIYVLEVLKSLLAGESLPKHWEDCITKGHDEAELDFEFSVEDDLGQRFRVEYSAQLGMSYLNESVKASIFQGGTQTRLNTILSTNSEDQDTIVLPDTKKRELFGSDIKLINELRVTKILCAKEHRSFLFSPELFTLMKKGSGDTPWLHMFGSLRRYGKLCLFVINNQSAGMIALDAGLPFNFRTNTALGRFMLRLDEPTVLPVTSFKTIFQVIDTINIVLREIIPGMEISLKSLGNEMTETGNLGVRVQLVRTAHLSESGDEIQLPLKYESEGIKKIISILHLFISAYNNPDITLAIDELDSGIYEYLLGELLQIMQRSGQGQLIFTSHNLRPLEMLNSSSITFTTTNPENRYVRAANIKPTNNLRLRYFRDITLGSDGEELYRETNSIEIAHAMRKVGVLVRDVVEES